MILKSDDFDDGGVLPKRCTCEGGDHSPSLRWSGVPAGTRSFTVICEDPDAPGATFTHWLLFNIPPETERLSADLAKDPLLPGGERQGENGFTGVGYGGPCPPPGPYHRYFFTLYALDAVLAVAPGADRSCLEKAMEGRVLDEARIVGRYRRVRLGKLLRRLIGR